MITINDLPSEILDEIFLQVGRRSHEELNNIRRVSRTWDERIKIKLRAVNPSEEWGRIIGSRIKKRFTSPSQPEIARAASMAHLGHLTIEQCSSTGQFVRAPLRNDDIAEMPRFFKQMTSVMRYVYNSSSCPSPNSKI